MILNVMFFIAGILVGFAWYFCSPRSWLSPQERNAYEWQIAELSDRIEELERK